MKTYLLAVISALLLFSCAESVREQEKTAPKFAAKALVAISLSGCYEMVIMGDSAFMNLVQNNDNLSGTLVYKRKEKDSNKGNVVLTKLNDRAEGYYTFQSEGRTSVRQIVFKINGDAFAEGYGNIEMKNDTAVLKYPHALNFEEKHTFNKVNCK